MPLLKICPTLQEDNNESDTAIEVNDVVLSMDVMAGGTNLNVDNNLEDMDEDEDLFGVKRKSKEV